MPQRSVTPKIKTWPKLPHPPRQIIPFARQKFKCQTGVARNYGFNYPTGGPRLKNVLTLRELAVFPFFFCWFYGYDLSGVLCFFMSRFDDWISLWKIVYDVKPLHWVKFRCVIYSSYLKTSCKICAHTYFTGSFEVNLV